MIGTVAVVLMYRRRLLNDVIGAKNKLLGMIESQDLRIFGLVGRGSYGEASILAIRWIEVFM